MMCLGPETEKSGRSGPSSPGKCRALLLVQVIQIPEGNFQKPRMRKIDRSSTLRTVTLFEGPYLFLTHPSSAEFAIDCNMLQTICGEHYSTLYPGCCLQLNKFDISVLWVPGSPV
jgi:hypothetical protein